MSWEPIDDAPPAEWIVYEQDGEVIGTYGQDEYKAKEVARACGGRDLGVVAEYVEVGG